MGLVKTNYSRGNNGLKKSMSFNSLLLCGAGKMGEALLNGWLSSGIDHEKIYVFEPNPSKWLTSLVEKGLNLNFKISQNPEVCVIAVKPQKIDELLLQNNFKNYSSTLFVSIAAGVKIKKFNQLLDKKTAIVRVMPNTPVTIKKGVSCLVSNENTSERQLELVELLFSVVGNTFRLSNESQLDAVTAVSGSGPAYVFYLIEVLTSAGIELGLEPTLANKLARLTVSGSGILAEGSDVTVDQLRENVTSPNGTTEAALKILMDSKTGLRPLIHQTVLAAFSRSKELGL